MTAFFVTGSGTDIGKTWVTAGLLAYWRAQGLGPGAFKPVATGYDPERPEDSDAAALLTALSQPVTAETVEAITPFRYRAPLSPDQAVRLEDARRLTAEGVALACKRLMRTAAGPVLLEGAGGVMSPLNESETMLDLALALGLPTIYVCGSYLGAISHALTGLAALKARSVITAMVLVNESELSTVDLTETCESLRSHIPWIPVLALPRGPSAAAVWPRVSSVLLA